MLHSRMQLLHASYESRSGAVAPSKPRSSSRSRKTGVQIGAASVAVHVLPMGVLEAAEREKGCDSRPVVSNEGHDVLRRRFARARVRVTTKVSVPNAAHVSTEGRVEAVTYPNLLGYRRLISELFGHAGVVPPSHIVTTPPTAKGRARTLQLVTSGGER